MGEIRENVQHNLKLYLNQYDITQKKLAEALGVSPAAVTNWIKGNNSPDLEMVAQICRFLEIPITDLLGFDTQNQYSEKERKLIQSYRQNKEIQKAVDILLQVH